MSKLNTIKVSFVDIMPEKLENGIVYISEKFALAIHKCCCGECGWETVMPFNLPNCDSQAKNPHAWEIILKKTEGAEDIVSFTPSIGNFQYPCKSHYYITDNNIIWI